MNQSTKSSIVLVIAMLAWGSVYPVSKYLMSEISPLTMSFLRYSTAVITLTPFFIIDIRKNSNKFNAKSLINLSIAGLAGTAVFALFLYAGVERSTASNGSIIINTQPVFAAVLAPLILKEKIRAIQIAGITVGLIGMLLVVTGGSFDIDSNNATTLTGNLLLIGGAISMSLYGILMKSPIREFGSIAATWISMTFGTFVLLIINITLNNNFFNELTISAGNDILLIIYLGSIATAAAYLLFSMALKHVEVVRATAFKFLIPVSGVGLSVLFLGERPVIASYAGIVIVIFSIFLIQRKAFTTAAEQKTSM